MKKHNIEPIFSSDSKVLILGSFPSVISRSKGFYYANKSNRFWKTVCTLLSEAICEDDETKKDILLRHKIALWDVVESCEITGSKDNTIRDITVNDIDGLLKSTDIKVIFLNGKTAEKLFDQYLKNSINIPSFYLPSTSSANAHYSESDLTDSWKVILEYL